MARDQIGREVSGKASESKALYIVFELGSPLILDSDVDYTPDGTFRGSIKLTTLDKISMVNNLSDLEPLYLEALA